MAVRRILIGAGVVLAAALVVAGVAVVLDRRGAEPETARPSTTSLPDTTTSAAPLPTPPSTEAAPDAPAEESPATTARAGRFPDATSTGPSPDVELVEVDAPAVWEVDEDVEGVIYTGMIVPSAPGITIRNSRIVADNVVAGVFNRDGHDDVTVENVEVVCTSDPEPTAAGVVGADVVRGSDIWGCADGIKAGSGDRIVGNYIHDLHYGPETHNDGIQVQAGADIVIEGNTIVFVDDGRRQANAAVFVQSTSGPVDGVSIRGNYVDGFGFSLRLNGSEVRNSEIVENVIGDGHLWGPFLIDAGAEAPGNGNRAAGNVRPDGTPIS